jgi:hypothetical protein
MSRFAILPVIVIDYNNIRNVTLQVSGPKNLPAELDTRRTYL